MERRQSHRHIQAAHQRGRGTYGAHKIQTELQASGISAGVNRIKRLRKLHGIRCTHKKKFKATTDSKHALPIAPNLLDRQFNHTSAANQVWLTDITYIPTDEGWLYLAAVKDLHTCELVGWAIESFFGTLKNESLHHYRFRTREQARRVVFEYIEVFYNRTRRHAKIGNQIPSVYAKQFDVQHVKKAA